MMAVEPMMDRDTFQTLLEGLFAEMPFNDPLYKLKSLAWDKFIAIGLPIRKTESYRYVPLRKLYCNSYVAAKVFQVKVTPHPECRGSCLVFVNGFFVKELSHLENLPDNVVILPLDEAIKSYDSFITKQWKEDLKNEEDPFAALNGALHQAGVFIYIPPNAVIKAPIEILHVIDGEGLFLIQPRMHLFAGKRSDVRLIRTQKVVRGTTFVVNGLFTASLDEGASMVVSQSILDEPEKSWSLEAARVTLKRDAVFKAYQATGGSETVRYDWRLKLLGDNAEAVLNGVALLTKTREAHTHIRIEHVAPNCKSMQRFKIALDGASRSSFEGKIFVHKEAQKTEAYQLNKNLLLSDRAQAFSKPNLEIFADDVKASHGATVGQLDAETLFYLKSRGLKESAAKRLLVLGFLKEVVDMVPVASLRGEIELFNKGMSDAVA